MGAEEGDYFILVSKPIWLTLFGLGEGSYRRSCSLCRHKDNKLSNLNLQSILEYFTIIQPQMNEELKESLNEFKQQTDTRIDKMKGEAKSCCYKQPKTDYPNDYEDLITIAQILIEIQLMKSN